MAATTENSERYLHRRDFLKFVNAGVILALLSSCILDNRDGLMPTQLHPSPNPEAPTSAPIEEDVTELPDGIEEIAPTPTATEVSPQYTVTPDIENFRDCYVSVEELLDGSYFRWLKDVIAPTLVPWFQEHEDKIKDVDLEGIDIPSGNVLIFDIDTMPNFEDPQTAPFKRDVTFGYTEWQESDGSTLMYRIYPVFYYDKKTQQVHPVITVDATFTEDQELIDKINRTYIEDMNLTLIHVDDTIFGDKDPIASQSFDNIGRDEMRARMLRFLHENDYSALSDEGIVLLTQALKAPIYK